MLVLGLCVCVYVCSCEMYIDVKSFCGFSFDNSYQNQQLLVLNAVWYVNVLVRCVYCVCVCYSIYVVHLYEACF